MTSDFATCRHTLGALYADPASAAGQINFDQFSQIRHSIRDAQNLVKGKLNELPPPVFSGAKVLQGIRDPEKVREIVDALASLGPRVVPLCIRSLEEKRPLRLYAMQLLIGELGEVAKTAIPALQEAQRDENEDVRTAATKSLELLQQ
jgi:HEAT repeat protein